MTQTAVIVQQVELMEARYGNGKARQSKVEGGVHEV